MDPDPAIPSKIIEENDQEILSLIHFFSKRHDKDTIYPVYLGGTAQKNYNEIKPLLDLDLIDSMPALKSCIFYRDKLEDYVFEKSSKKIEKLTKKINSLNMKDPYAPRVKTRFENQIRDIKSQKKAFTILLRYSKKIPANRRIPDQNRKIRNYIIEIIGRFNIDTHEKKDVSDKSQGKKFVNDLETLGFYKEYSPAKCYTITPLGVAVQEKLVVEKVSEKTEEELEFDRLMARIGDINKL